MDYEFSFETIEDISILTRSIGQPAIEYYNENFNDESGDCYNIRKMANTTKIFNLLFLKGKSDTEIVTILHPLANELKHFGYRHFTQEFIDKLKIELHLIVQESNQNGVLDSIRSSTRFKTRMENRIKKEDGE